MFPLDVSTFGPLEAGLVSLGIGFAFGFVLEQAGFGDSRKLAAQFHLHDQAVIKVMFTGIVVALVLLTATDLLGGLDASRLFVPATFLGPHVIGGLLLGMGFYIGGY